MISQANFLTAHTGGQEKGQSEVRKVSLNCTFHYAEGGCIQPNTKTALHHGHTNRMYIHLYSHNYTTGGIHNFVTTGRIRHAALSNEACFFPHTSINFNNKTRYGN